MDREGSVPLYTAVTVSQAEYERELEEQTKEEKGGREAAEEGKVGM